MTSTFLLSHILHSPQNLLNRSKFFFIHTKIFIVYLKIKLKQGLSCIFFQSLLLCLVTWWVCVCLWVWMQCSAHGRGWIPWIWHSRRRPAFWSECWESNPGTLPEQCELFTPLQTPDVLCFYLVLLLQFYSGTVSAFQWFFKDPCLGSLVSLFQTSAAHRSIVSIFYPLKCMLHECRIVLRYLFISHIT